MENKNSAEVIVKFEEVTKKYGDLVVLDKLNLDIKKNEMVSIIGPSGSGKTTVLRVLMTLEKINGGIIHLDGETLSHMNSNGKLVEANEKYLRKKRSKIGMVFQQFNLFPHLTVLENLTIGPIKVRKVSKSEAEIMARKYLDRVHIPEQAEKFPAELSGGQQQRVAIARSLCMESKILLFDEPTSALDPEMINEVLDVMVELADTGMTMVCVTHEMGFARKVADTMVFMDEGKIIEVAPPDKFFSKPESARCREFLEQILEH